MDKLPDTLNKVLDGLSKRFGATGTELWKVYVHYIWACGLTATLTDLITIAFTIYWLVTLSARFKKGLDVASKYIDDSEVVIYVYIILVSICAIICTIAAICSIQTDLPQMLAPAGAAIQNILQAK